MPRDRERAMEPVARAAKALSRGHIQQRCVVLVRGRGARLDPETAHERAFAGDMQGFAHQSCILSKHPDTDGGPESVEVAAEALCGHIREAAAAATIATDLARAFGSLVEELGSKASRECGDLDEVGRKLQARFPKEASYTCAVSGKLAWFDPIQATVPFDWVQARPAAAACECIQSNRCRTDGA